MQIPAKDAYVIPTGSDFITCDKQNMQRMIVIILSNEGIIFVNPFALLAKVLEAVPNPTAKIKIKYGSRVFSISSSYLKCITYLLRKPYRLMRPLHPPYHLPNPDHNADDSHLPQPETQT
tara:strand:+ start:313 stop:672 length:360 start_codon:yes stop_codon:yes gene_type:complete